MPVDPIALESLLIKRELARRYFRQFVKYFIESTNSELLWNWHLDYLCDILQSVTARDPATRFLIVNMPPRFAKSTIAGVLWQAWMIGRDNSSRSGIFSIASSGTLAARDSLKTLNTLREPWYQAVFPSIILDKETEVEWSTKGGAFRVCSGAEGTVTGRGASRLVCDDLLQSDEADSPLIRTKRNEWLGRTLRSRLDDPKTGTITIIQQRLHEQDTTGYLLEQMKTPGADRFSHIVLPLESKEYTVVEFNGKVYAERKPGDLLHPARIGPDEVLSMRISQGHNFEAQYQQDPKAREGGFFELADLQWYRPEELPPVDSLNWMLGADYATSNKTTSDHTAVVLAGMDAHRVLWVHPETILARLDPLAAVTRTVKLAKKFKTFILGHEKGVIANTLAPLFTMVQRDENHYLATETYSRTSSKAVHAAAVKGLMRAGLVKLPIVHKPIWEPLLLRFRPDVDGDQDDLIDALATIGILVDRSVMAPPKPSTAYGDSSPMPNTWAAMSNSLRDEIQKRKAEDPDSPTYRDREQDWW